MSTRTPFLLVVMLSLSGCDCSGVVGLWPVVEEDADAGDAGPTDDAGIADAGAPDAGAPDAGAPDAGAPDAGAPDAGPADAGAPDAAVTFVGLDWFKSVDGAHRPVIRALPDGGLVGTFTIAYNTPVIIGAGEPAEVTWSGHFNGVVVWLDAASGNLQRVRRGNANVPNVGGGAIGLSDDTFAVAPNGDAVLWGTFSASVTFTPDTSPNSQSTLTQLNGGILDRAEDPYLLRYSAGGVAQPFVRGRTPPPLNRTWFNTAVALAVLSDGDVIVHGAYQQGGFVFPDGRPGQVTLPTGSGNLSYLARIQPNGSAAWVRRIQGFYPTGKLATAPDGSIYFSVQGSGTLFPDTGTPIVIAPSSGSDGGGGLYQNTIVKLDASGQLAWLKQVVSDSCCVAPAALAVLHGGLVAWNNTYTQGAPLQLRDQNGGPLATFNSPGANAAGWMARFEADGTLAWFRGFEDAASVAGVVEWGTGYYALAMLLAGGRIGLEQGTVPALPPNLDGGWSNLGVTLSATGQRTRIDVVGENMYISLGALAKQSQTGLVAAGLRIAQSPEPLVFLRDGGVVNLPLLPTSPNNTGVYFFRFSP